MALQRKGMEIATFQPIAAGKCSYRLLVSRWDLLKGYRKATGKYQNTCCQPIGEEVELPRSYQKNVAIYFPFL